MFTDQTIPTPTTNPGFVAPVFPSSLEVPSASQEGISDVAGVAGDVDAADLEDEDKFDEDIEDGENADGERVNQQPLRALSSTPEPPADWEPMWPELAQELDAMPTSARRRVLARHLQSRYGWVQENNIARNRAMLNQLEIRQAKELLFNEHSNSKAPSDESDQMSTNPCQLSTLQQTSYQTPDPPSLPLPATIPYPASSLLPPHALAAHDETQDVGVIELRKNLLQWMSLVLPLLDEDSETRGEEWKELTKTWIQIERIAGFAINGPVSKLNVEILTLI